VPAFTNFKQDGPYLDMQVKVPLPLGHPGRISYVLGSTAEYFRTRLQESAAQTKYDVTIKNGLEIPLPGNFSLQPTYELFFFKNRGLSRNTLSRDTLKLKLKYSFQRYTHTPWLNALTHKQGGKEEAGDEPEQ
jgi:hypothetical protein